MQKGDTVAVRLTGDTATIVNDKCHCPCVVPLAEMDKDDRGFGHIYPGKIIDTTGDKIIVSIRKSIWQPTTRPYPVVGDIVAVQIAEYLDLGILARMVDHNNVECLIVKRSSGRKPPLGQYFPAVVLKVDKECFDVSIAGENWVTKEQMRTFLRVNRI